MNTIIKISKTLRNHWKKSTFAAVCLAYGINFAKTKYEMLQMMRVYCEEAKVFGDMPIGNLVKPRHLTVIMNPAAKNSKGMALYEKYALPLLHLAGIRISLIKTEYEGQAKALMEVMDNTDAVVVAGGDGTLAEVVTGLCKRSDETSAIERFPLGIVPIGKTNTVAKYLFWDDHANECRLLAESAMAIIKGNMKTLDVMSMTTDDEKQVYSLVALEWGYFRNVKVKIPQYWYWGFLKTKVAYFFDVFKKHSDPLEANLFYTLPCEGCSKCHLSKSVIKSETVLPKRWWQAFIPRKTNHQQTSISKDYSKIINDDCGVWYEKDVKTIDLSIETVNNRPNTEMASSLRINIGPEYMKSMDFLRNAWAIDHSNYFVSKSNMQDVQVIYADKVKLETDYFKDKESWYSIDNENFEAKPVHIQLLPKKIKVFCK